MKARHRYQTASVVAALLAALLQLAAESAWAYYNPHAGRWLSRDPIGERGGQHLYGFVANAPPLRFDQWGLFDGATVPGSPATGIPKPPPPPAPPPPPPPSSSLGLYVCCRAVMPENSDSWCTRKCGKWFRHCNLSSDNKSGQCDSGDNSYPIEKADNGSMDNGTSCSQATAANIQDCLKRNKYDRGEGTWGNNCQSNTRERLGKCCLKSTWNPNIYAYPVYVPEGWPPSI